ncbi:MAG: hypothetical protein LKF62_04755 [Solobacterium sp.]|nr:hypothetical protein [Solobacterium sp.]
MSPDVLALKVRMRWLCLAGVCSKALKIERTDDVKAAAYVNGACITDSYWIKPAGSNLKYSDIRFKENHFAMMALKGDTNIYGYDLRLIDTRTPELTNIGCAEKCWIVAPDNQWHLIKRGTPQMIFSEMFVYLLGRMFGYSMAEYMVKDSTAIESVDFTDNASENYETIQSLINDRTDDYALNYDVLMNLNPSAALDYVRMLYLDAIVRNPDRHEFNYGVLRDRSSGAVRGLAPNFDNNLALISTGPIASTKRTSDTMIRDFCELINSRQIKFDLPMIPTVNQIDRLVRQINVEVNTDGIAEFIINGMTAAENQII